MTINVPSDFLAARELAILSTPSTQLIKLGLCTETPTAPTTHAANVLTAIQLDSAWSLDDDEIDEMCEVYSTLRRALMTIETIRIPLIRKKNKMQ